MGKLWRHYAVWNMERGDGMPGGFETPIQYLKGVGPRRAELYHKLGIETVRQLLWHFPRSYVNFGENTEIASVESDQICSVRAMVMSKSGEQRIRKGLSIFKVTAADDTAEITLVFYNTKYAVEALSIGQEYFFYGRIGGSGFRREMHTPQVFTLADAERGMLSPVYPLTAGLTSRIVSANMAQALELTAGERADFLPTEPRLKYQLCELEFALCQIHRPKDTASAEIAKKRLIFDEFLILALAMSSIRGKRSVETGYQMKEESFTPFYGSLPFRPTGAQEKAVAQSCRDMCREVPMNRLVQGDVGSGKTLVAAACCWFAWKNGFQSAMMAPTEILAMQHLETLRKFWNPLE